MKVGPITPQIERAADHALAAGVIVVLDDVKLVIVPDTLLLEAVANGHGDELTGAAHLQRADGRIAYVWKLP